MGDRDNHVHMKGSRSGCIQRTSLSGWGASIAISRTPSRSMSASVRHVRGRIPAGAPEGRRFSQEDPERQPDRPARHLQLSPAGTQVHVLLEERPGIRNRDIECQLDSIGAGIAKRYSSRKSLSQIGVANGQRRPNVQEGTWVLSRRSWTNDQF